MAKRARGTGRWRERESRRETAFERLVDRAIASIPEPFAAALEEVAIVIEDEPTEQQLADNDVPPDETLYGLYEGVPRTAYEADWAMAPNRITLFLWPLEDEYSDPAALEAEVRRTVVHELAHHLGIDDDRLDELGAG